MSGNKDGVLTRVFAGKSKGEAQTPQGSRCKNK
jgi:hypothetical protein